ncbi:hypothetical protein PPYR_01415 [Photinus pyralis]|uniref:DDE Tnp4 domain-containing protein n=1 Tax=Photinus pyralis TaxID=7054 RepID=A0A5N4B4C6_PHOPY|nr:hypothetical protein PPYR_01415 [Photinus pyralis]
MVEDIYDIFHDLISDDEENFVDLVEAPRNIRTFRVRPNHMEMWNNQEFINRFRISKGSVEILLQEIGQHLEHPTNQNHAVQPLHQFLITLRFYATFGGIDKSTTSRIIMKVSSVISGIARQYIKMPSNENFRRVANGFHNLARFPNVVGAIDCTHIRIHSPGVIKAEFEEGRYRNGFLIGDSGYTLTKYLMIPLANPITRPEQLYNESLIRTRNVVERQYVLRLERRLKLDTVLSVIIATAVLHNIAIDNNDLEPNNQDIMAEIYDVPNEVPLENPNENALTVRNELINNCFANLVEIIEINTVVFFIINNVL